tara:strand:- start:543 stop:803 length:261 start_codon:yes stop_codon:yes gene_type:complete
MNNEKKLPQQYEEFVTELEYEISNLVRQKILSTHDENGDGLKFMPDSNELDIAIRNNLIIQQYNPTTRGNSNVENLLTAIDAQHLY